MNETLIIGRKATRKNILVSFIAFIFYGLIGGIGTGGLLTFLTPLNRSICIFIGIIAFFVTMLIVVPLATITDYLEINPIFINYYVYKGYFQMFLETINLIIGKKTYPQKQINLNDIKNIELSYEPISMLWAQKGYKIKLLFHLNNQSIIPIYPSGHPIRNNDYEKLLVLLENKSIPIIDKHHLRNFLKTNPPSDGPSGPNKIDWSPVRSSVPIAYALSCIFDG